MESWYQLKFQILVNIEGSDIMQEIKEIITLCDKLITEERFDELMLHYTEDAILVIKPELIAQGRASIKNAFIKIAEYFKNSVKPTQGEMKFLEAGDIVLVISQTILDSSNKNESEYSMERKATYVFKKVNNQWLCCIDNSYGTDII